MWEQSAVRAAARTVGDADGSPAENRRATQRGTPGAYADCVSDAFAYVILVVGIIGFFFIFRALRAHDPRRDEDLARAFFDEHGHWPDQTPEEAEAERRELASSAYSRHSGDSPRSGADINQPSRRR